MNCARVGSSSFSAAQFSSPYILKDGELGFIRPEEARKKLMKIAKWELWEAEKIGTSL